MHFSVPPRGVEVVLLMLVLAASVYDIRYRRIPNWLTAGGVVVGIAMNSFLFGFAGTVESLKGFFLAFGVYAALYALHAMGAGDVKLMAAVGSMVGWEDWFAIFLVTAVIGGIMSLILVAVKGRMKKTLFNVGFILSEMRSGRPAYLKNEELDVKSKKAMGLPHGAVIAVGTLFFLGLAIRYAT